MGNDYTHTHTRIRSGADHQNVDGASGVRRRRDSEDGEETTVGLPLLKNLYGQQLLLQYNNYEESVTWRNGGGFGV